MKSKLLFWSACCALHVVPTIIAMQPQPPSPQLQPILRAALRAKALSPAKPIFPCKLCSFPAQTQESLISHLKDKHINKASELAGIEFSPDGKIICKFKDGSTVTYEGNAKQ